MRTIGIVPPPAASRSALAAGIVILGRVRARRGPCHGGLDAEDVGSRLDTKETHFPPVLSPAVPHDPILVAFLVDIPPHDGNDVIHNHFSKVHSLVHPSLVTQDGIGIDPRRHGTAAVNFRFDLMHAVEAQQIVRAVFCDGGVGEEVDLGARPALGCKCAARAAGVVLGARRVDVLAESLVAIVRACEVRHACVVGDVALGLGEFVHTGMAPSPAAPRDARPAVQHVLHAQVDIIAGTSPCDLDPIGERAQRAVGPARSAILGNVLIQ
mmetsp:Transcript_35917/g.86700  ORF Transcript_35917/g.86700 Transcript_35917/m.86700 type:complete len:268 (+) Transcript_35917:2-805(+)